MCLHTFHDLEAAVADDIAIAKIELSPACKTINVKLTDEADSIANPLANVVRFLNKRSIPFSLGLDNSLQAA
jgi:hypothetical protein